MKKKFRQFAESYWLKPMKDMDTIEKDVAFDVFLKQQLKNTQISIVLAVYT